MLQGVHERKISENVSAGSTGDNIIIAGTPERWLLIHELIGSLDGTGTVIVKAGARELGTFELSANQGLTEQDEPGEDNRPRFECRPGEDFILNLTMGVTFTGSVHYSYNY
ncbi:MAG: hypothetical protein V4509_00435 [Patescibacteria group bacterium]